MAVSVDVPLTLAENPLDSLRATRLGSGHSDSSAALQLRVLTRPAEGLMPSSGPRCELHASRMLVCVHTHTHEQKITLKSTNRLGGRGSLF